MLLTLIHRIPPNLHGKLSVIVNGSDSDLQAFHRSNSSITVRRVAPCVA